MTRQSRKVDILAISINTFDKIPNKRSTTDRAQPYNSQQKATKSNTVIKPSRPVLTIVSLQQKVDEKILPLLMSNSGSSGSLIERAAFAAEGTSTVDGRKTKAYFGHQDPMCKYITCEKFITNLGSLLLVSTLVA